MSAEARRARLTSLIVAALAFAYASIVVFSRIDRGDEAWFLQVVSRVASGDVLYRDMFFGATPLSVYATLPAVAAFGVDVAWVKLNVVVCSVCSVLLAVRIGRQLGLTDRRSSLVLLVLALLVWSPPVVGAVYQPLATVFLLACFSLTLDWRSRAEARPLLLAAAAAALAFASKHNVGMLALAALLGSVAFGVPGSPRARAARAAAVVAVFSVLAAALLAPIALSGGTAAFLDYGFTSKGGYLRLAPTLYFDQFVALGSLLKPGGQSDLRHQPGLFYWRIPFLLVPFALVALPLAWSKAGPNERRRGTVVALFALAAAAAVFPGTVTHLRFVAAGLVLPAAYAASLLIAGSPRNRVLAAKLALAIWLVPGLVALGVLPVYRIAAGETRLSELPGFRGAFVPAQEQRLLLRNNRELRGETRTGPLFLLSPDASFYYVSAGLRDPTAFDIPEATVFRRTVERDLIAQIANGELRVCARFDPSSNLTPKRLERFVERHLRPVRSLGACTLYG